MASSAPADAQKHDPKQSGAHDVTVLVHESGADGKVLATLNLSVDPDMTADGLRVMAVRVALETSSHVAGYVKSHPDARLQPRPSTELRASDTAISRSFPGEPDKPDTRCRGCFDKVVAHGSLFTLNLFIDV